MGRGRRDRGARSPGASAVLAAVASSGVAGPRWSFEGFLPRSGRERRERLEQLASDERGSVLFEAPTRLAATLRDLAAACGPDRPGAVCRELTKLHEQVVEGPAGRAGGTGRGRDDPGPRRGRGRGRLGERGGGPGRRGGIGRGRGPDRRRGARRRGRGGPRGRPAARGRREPPAARPPGAWPVRPASRGAPCTGRGRRGRWRPGATDGAIPWMATRGRRRRPAREPLDPWSA